jgi:hypothetical protein
MNEALNSIFFIDDIILQKYGFKIYTYNDSMESIFILYIQFILPFLPPKLLVNFLI